MSRVLLVQCPCSFGTEMPPLGLSYLSAFLKKNHVDTAVLDLSIELYHAVGKQDQELWKSNNGYCWYLTDVFETLPFLNDALYDAFTDRILAEGRAIIGFSVQNTSALFTREILRRIKKKDPFQKIILGGPNCYNTSGCDADFKLLHGLERWADVIVVGEGEAAVLSALAYLESGTVPIASGGLALPEKGAWSMRGLPDPIRDLDALPFPDFDAFPLDRYTDGGSFPILGSRGCVMRCVFCTDTYFWISYRRRRAEAVVEEILRAKEAYGRHVIHFNDSLVNGDRGNVLKMCDLLIAKNAGVQWGGNCRVDPGLALADLKKMKRAGCRYLILGIESASDKVLKLMRKGFTIREARDFIIRCQKAGIAVTVNWIVGFPGETEDDFAKTVRFVKQHRRLIARNTFSALTINQFSALERHKEDFGVLLDGPHLGLWRSAAGDNTIDVRTRRLQALEEVESGRRRDYSIVRQISGALTRKRP